MRNVRGQQQDQFNAIVRKQQQNEAAELRPFPRFVFMGKTGKI
jgi:hypothetical protein